MPAVVAEGLADIALDIGSEGTGTVVVLVVAFAGEEADEAVLDGALQMMGHVVVHPFEAEGHTDRLVGAILGAIFSLHPWVSEIDTGNNKVIHGDIVLEDATKAMFPDRTVLTLADDAFSHHFAEKVFSGLRGRGGLL